MGRQDSAGSPAFWAMQALNQTNASVTLTYKGYETHKQLTLYNTAAQILPAYSEHSEPNEYLACHTIFRKVK